jgi:four helix bundle protein
MFIRFEDIKAWQKGQDLAVLVYRIFKDCKDWDFRNQIRRATVSISNNIAEGFNRSSNADFSRFLYISLGSCSEVKSMLYLSVRLEYLTDAIAEPLMKLVVEISKILTALINSMKAKEK